MDRIKPKRSRNGCQACKEGRVKCDLSKPSCKNCIKKNLCCDYSKKLTWITFENHDSRHPSYKKRKDSPTFSNDEEGLASSQVELPQPLRGDADRTEETDMLNVEEEYEILYENSEEGEEEEEEDLSNIPKSTPTDSQDDESVRELEITMRNITHNGNVKVDFARFFDYHKRFSSFFRSFPQQTYNVFKNKETDNLFAHYLLVTCVSLDPLNGSGPSNISEKFFVPFAIYNPSTLHGMLSMSSSQLAVTNPQYKRLALIHKSLSYKHLYALLKDREKSIGLSAICAIICHLSIEIIESNSKNWKIHIEALRMIVTERAKRGIKNDEFAKFIYFRIARYDCFASLTLGNDPLFDEFRPDDLEGLDPLARNLDGVFGCPSNILLYCAKLSSLSKKRYDFMNDNKELKHKSVGEINQMLSIDEIGLLKKMHYLLNQSSRTVNTKEWQLVEQLWKFAMIIQYDLCVKDNFNHQRGDLNEMVNTFLKICEELVNVYVDGLFFSNLAFPIMRFLEVIPPDQIEQREALMNVVDVFFKRSSIRTFDRLKYVVREIWDLKAQGSFVKPSDWWKYDKERGWNIYLA